MLVSFKKACGCFDIRCNFSWKSSKHRHANADAGLVRICQESAGYAQIHAFGHAIKKTLAASFEARCQANHSGSPSTAQFFRSKAIFSETPDVNGADPAGSWYDVLKFRTKHSPHSKIRIQL